MDSYGRLLPSGKFPQGALFIEIESSEVDVNVHPTKHEIRFRNQSLVGNIIKQSIGNMLSSAPWMLGYGETIRQREKSFYDQKQGYNIPGGISKTRQPPSPINNEPLAPVFTHEKNFENSYTSFTAEKNATPTEQLFENPGYFSSMKILGQVGALYIVCENENGIILIDQHAAHERVNYEKFKNIYTIYSIISYYS